MRRLQLQVRDCEILDALAEWGPMDADAITRRWFTSRDKARKRLLRLVAHGHCRRMLIGRNVPAVYYTGQFNAQSLHKAAVNRIRVQLAEMGDLVEFETEIEFRGSQHRADALITWRPQGAAGEMAIFLEVDMGTETAVQIREKVGAYREYFSSIRWQQHWAEFPGILWIADQPRLVLLARWIGRMTLPAGMRFLYGLEALSDAPAKIIPAD